MFSLWMHMLLNDLLVAMVVVVMESNTYFQFLSVGGYEY
jgi:hypothetical protein